jgi:ABC-type dipeptide/oligopeptide/nickel transport system permease component
MTLRATRWTTGEPTHIRLVERYFTYHAFKHTVRGSPPPMNSTVAAAIPWDVVLSTVGGVLATLVGVLVGGAISSRAQTRHWTLHNPGGGVRRRLARVRPSVPGPDAGELTS